MNQIWVGNLEDFKTLPEIIKLHYNEYLPHQSFDNKTPMEVRIEAAKNKLVRSHQRKMDKWDAFYWAIPSRTTPAAC